MKWFAKKIFYGREIWLKLRRKVSKTFNYDRSFLFRYKDFLIPFFVLGIPFFVELFLIFNYHELHYESFMYNSTRTVIRITELYGIFASIYVLLITTQSNMTRKIFILIWIFLLYIPVNFEFICTRVTGTLLSNDFMSAIFNTHIRETLLTIQEYFVLICLNLIVISCAFF